MDYLYPEAAKVRLFKERVIRCYEAANPSKLSEIDKLIQKYEGTSTDPYNKFYEYMQNIQFGTPFVEHIAKKTYIKTKPNNNIAAFKRTIFTIEPECVDKKSVNLDVVFPS